MRRAILLAIALLLVAAGAAAPLRAQGRPRPHLEWRTFETPRFVVHFPAELETWTRHAVARMESVQDAVSASVGYERPGKITVVVDDPLALANGYAFPAAGVLWVWPTPPGPESMIGSSRDWSELLFVHELAHVAHLSRPSRNPRERFLWRLLPVARQPIEARMPPWAVEGYATVVEGRLTGAGRPFGVWRPGVLRGWALAGQLPTYAELNGNRRYLGNAARYLGGSAYIEWLAARSGDESLPSLWRRLTARQTRDFDDAFSGVFGGPPAELYGLFAVDATAKSLAVREVLVAAGLAEGEPFQRLDGPATDLAIAPDGRHLAVQRQPREERPSEIVVWTTAPDTLATAVLEARARARALDPEDVPDVEWRPEPKTPVARLAPAGGRGHRAPRWMPDGEGILVIRNEGTGDGALRPDLFLWRWREGSLTRLTRDAGIHAADPAPDGSAAYARRCLHGICDVARVDLATGAVRVLAAGTPARPYGSPRVAPDGASLVVPVQEGARWRLARLATADGEFLGWVDPDDGRDRFDVAFLPGGRAIVAVSSAGGVLDLERIDLATRTAAPVTRVLTAALSPAVGPDSTAYFLHGTTRGADVRRIDAGTTLGPDPALDPALAPAAPGARPEAPAFALVEPGPARPYGLGPRARALYPWGRTGPEGWSAGAALHDVDPVGRLAWHARGGWGEESAWRGGGLALVWRGTRPGFGAEGFWARQRPSEQEYGAPAALDVEIAGGLAQVALERSFPARSERWRIGGSGARLDAVDPAGGDGDAFDGAARWLGFAEGEAAWLATPGTLRLTARARLHGAAGETAGDGWRRAIGSLRLAAAGVGSGIAVVAEGGGTDGGGPFEALALGGGAPPLFDDAVLSQRLADPALPVAWATGERLATLRGELTLRGLTGWMRWAAAGEELDDWDRVVGVEASSGVPQMPYIRLPAARVIVGASRVLNGPGEDDTRFFLSLDLEP